MLLAPLVSAAMTLRAPLVLAFLLQFKIFIWAQIVICLVIAGAVSQDAPALWTMFVIFCHGLILSSLQIRYPAGLGLAIQFVKRDNNTPSAFMFDALDVSRAFQKSDNVMSVCNFHICAPRHLAYCDRWLL